MPSPLTQAGATPEPTQYAPLTMDRYITGLWTQRSPLRDADVPYLYGKFYSASRFDSIIDGINREITARLTIQRRCGTSVYSATALSAVNTFYSFNAVQEAAQQMYLMSDTASEVYYSKDGGASAGLFAKSAGAGTSRFLGVGAELFFGNGVDQKKWLLSGKTWQPSTAYLIGDFIVDSNNNLQAIVPQSEVFNITNLKIVNVTPTVPIHYPTKTFLVITCSTSPQGIGAMQYLAAGLTGYPALNGQTLQTAFIQQPYLDALALTADQAAFYYSAATYGPAAETGTLTTSAFAKGGNSGVAQPVWNTITGGITTDGSIQWVCCGSAVQDWTMAAPVNAPTLSPSANNRYWQANTNFAANYSVLDSNGFVQAVVDVPGPGSSSGPTQPAWNSALGGYTYDGALQWINCGAILAWQPSSAVQHAQCVIDTNQNLQVALVVTSPGTTGSAQPAWATGLGATTVDNDVTWTNMGPGVVLISGSVQFAYSYAELDGTVTTASPTATIPNGILGPQSATFITITGDMPATPQCIKARLWATAQGQSTLILLDDVANSTIGTASTWTYGMGAVNYGAINPFIAAPINSANNPPPAGFTAPTYHMSRVWGIVGSTVYYSGGPDTIVGNGNTAFAPLSSFRFPELVTRLIPITVNNGGLMVMGTRNVYIILGTGTASNPFYDTLYMPTVGFLNYDAMCMVGSTLYGFTSNRKFVSLDPSAGYVECGFPIGDQFNNVTTGNAFGGVPVGALYDPAKTYVTWNERESGDSGIYVSDGAVGWFRYSPVAAPESGYLWSPRAAITGGTSAVLSVETSPGVQTLLIGPSTAAPGPILQRDPTVFTDWTGDAATNYSASYVTIGNIVLCEPGEVAEVAFVTLDSMCIGAPPQVGMLYGEISATTNVPFDMIDVTSADPPDLPESETLYSDRYVTMHDGVCPKCRHCQVMMSWPAQSEGDELLAHAIYGAKFAERKEQ